MVQDPDSYAGDQSSYKTHLESVDHTRADLHAGLLPCSSRVPGKTTLPSAERPFRGPSPPPSISSCPEKTGPSGIENTYNQYCACVRVRPLSMGRSLSPFVSLCSPEIHNAASVPNSLNQANLASSKERKKRGPKAANVKKKAGRWVRREGRTLTIQPSLPPPGKGGNEKRLQILVERAKEADRFRVRPRVCDNDVQTWPVRLLDSLQATPQPPIKTQKTEQR